MNGAARARSRMVKRDLEGRGIRDTRVLAAMETVPREYFVPDHAVGQAYEDRPLDIGEGQTISQPYIVALMSEAAQIGPDDHVLEIGTGSGYQTAILARLAQHVDSVERLPRHAEAARARLADLGIRNVAVHVGDGARDLPPGGRWDAVLVTAAAPRVPAPLQDRLADGGRLVIPLGDRTRQHLVRLQRRGSGYDETDLGPVRFVPLVSPDAFDADAI